MADHRLQVRVGRSPGARAVRDFVRTVTLTVPTGHVSTALSALYGELPALPMAQ